MYMPIQMSVCAYMHACVGVSIHEICYLRGCRIFICIHKCLNIACYMYITYINRELLLSYGIGYVIERVGKFKVSWADQQAGNLGKS